MKKLLLIALSILATASAFADTPILNLKVAGTLNGTPSGGTLNLSSVTLTIPSSLWASPSAAIGSGTPVAITGTTITATDSVVASKVNGSSKASLTFADAPGNAGLSVHASSGSSILYIWVNGAQRWVMNDNVFQAVSDTNYFAAGIIGSNTVAAYGNRVNGGVGLGFPASDSTALISGGVYALTASSTALTAGLPLVILTHTPSSASDTGVAGTITWDGSYVYVCTATNTWKRVAISTW